MMPKNDSMIELSMQLPFLDIDCLMPFSFSAQTNLGFWYCQPWLEFMVRLDRSFEPTQADASMRSMCE